MLPTVAGGPGLGERWLQLAEWLRERLDPTEIDGIWVFKVVRRDKAEYGTAVLSLVAGERRRIVTACYVATIKGKERGDWDAELVEVGSGPLEALEELLELVPIRADDEESPSPVEPVVWFPPIVEEDPDPGAEELVVSEEESDD